MARTGDIDGLVPVRWRLLITQPLHLLKQGRLVRFHLGDEVTALVGGDFEGFF